jgi:hypothetical protein
MSPPDFTKRNVSDPQPQFDPVTGAPVLPGPAAYSAVDPAQTPEPFGYPGSPPAQGYPTTSYQAPGYPTSANPAAGYPPQGYPAQEYPAQGYPPAGYPGAGYPPGGPAQQYAPGYAAAGYPVAGQPPAGYPGGYAPVGYQMVPMYPVPGRPAKPGAATAASVLAYVQSGFVLIGSLVMFSGSAGLDDFSRGNNLSSELTVIGILTVLAGGLLIAGATTLLNRKPGLLLLGNALSIAVSLYFVLRLMDFVYGIALWVPILYAVLPIISIALACTTDVRTWARARTHDRE